MSDIDTNLNNTEEISATKNVRLKCDTEGESLPLAPAGKPSSDTPSPRGSAPKTRIQFHILDLFSGAGGFSCGLDMVEGFKTEVATDFDPKVLNTFQKNFPDTCCICGDVCSNEIKQQIINKARERKVNMIVGGPPCQGFSLKGKNLGIKDSRNFLFMEYVNIVKELQPKIFIIENVKNLINSANGFFIKQIYEEFEKLGYKLNHGILNAYDFGVPQTRERAIIIGTLLDKKISLPNKFDLKRISVRDAISDLDYLESGEGEEISNYKYEPKSEYQRLLRDNSKKLYNHKATNHSQIALEKLKLIPPEGDKSSMPKELYGKQKFQTTWSRLIWDKPSPTIDTRFDTPSNGRNSHPFLNRSITPREAARIQSFPDSFIFYGNKCSICKQIGNAVPPLLAKTLAEHIKEQIEND
ncbi:MAG: DNA cytosine methyltransferase [Treponema sp.]|nr:DNA cytosine methyltransferase [Treponema sp.]